jgi:hypothetical protein
VDKIVDRQMRHWELARTGRKTTSEPRRREVEDFISISRMAGLEDSSVAARLGERLDWSVFDRQILDVMAGDDELRQRIYRFMDERDLSWWEETLRPLLEPQFTRNDYFHQLCRTVLSLARQGHGVFVGRGADRILPQEEGFRVRLVAPVEWRVERYAERHRVGREAAREELQRLRKERTDFLHHHFDVDADDPTRTDLVINLGRLSEDQAVEVILAARRICQGGAPG